MSIKKFITHSTLYIAHRGESISAPENTLEAINLAWQNGADGIEIDVHLSSDNEIIVIHDKSTKRMTGEYRLIRRNTVAEIKRLNIKKNGFNYNYDVKIPTLIEALKTVPAGKYIFIEIKCGIEILPRLKQILKKTTVDIKHIKLISFNLGVISAIKKALPQYETLWVMRIGIEKSALFLNGLSSIISKAKQNNIDGFDISYSRFFNQKLVQKIQSNNLKLYIWTINNLNKSKRLSTLKIDGIISDKASDLKSKTPSH